MKKKDLVIFLMISLLILSSCSYSNDIGENNSQDIQGEENHGETEKANSSEEEITQGEDKYATDGFAEVIANNPIDVEYANLEYNGDTTIYINKLTGFERCWWNEMMHAIEVLKPLLNEEDCQAFLEAQQAWEIYYNENKKVQTSFYQDYNYELIGNMHSMMMVDENIQKARERTFEIIEYVVGAGGEYTFIFDPETDVIIE